VAAVSAFLAMSLLLAFCAQGRLAQMRTFLATRTHFALDFQSSFVGPELEAQMICRLQFDVNLTPEAGVELIAEVIEQSKNTPQNEQGCMEDGSPRALDDHDPELNTPSAVLQLLEPDVRDLVSAFGGQLVGWSSSILPEGTAQEYYGNLKPEQKALTRQESLRQARSLLKSLSRRQSPKTSKNILANHQAAAGSVFPELPLSSHTQIVARQSGQGS